MYLFFILYLFFERTSWRSSPVQTCCSYASSDRCRIQSMATPLICSARFMINSLLCNMAKNSYPVCHWQELNPTSWWSLWIIPYSSKVLLPFDLHCWINAPWETMACLEHAAHTVAAYWWKAHWLPTRCIIGAELRSSCYKTLLMAKWL